MVVTSSPPVYDDSSICPGRSHSVDGDMTRRTGANAGRDVGSTTGVATAVLALLSAGTLATLGVVTAGDLRDAGRGPVGAAQVDGVGPPAPIALTPTPATAPAPGGRAGGAGGGRG